MRERMVRVIASVLEIAFGSRAVAVVACLVGMGLVIYIWVA
jgi:hypothetical protein